MDDGGFGPQARPTGSGQSSRTADVCPRECRLHDGQRGLCFVRGAAGARSCSPSTAAPRGSASTRSRRSRSTTSFRAPRCCLCRGGRSGGGGERGGGGAENGGPVNWAFIPPVLLTTVPRRHTLQTRRVAAQVRVEVSAIASSCRVAWAMHSDSVTRPPATPVCF
jgi:hypothetical protein